MFFSYINSVLKILCYNLAYFYEKPVFITILQQYNFRLNLHKKLVYQAERINSFITTLKQEFFVLMQLYNKDHTAAILAINVKY